jgi:hypothetical protein
MERLLTTNAVITGQSARILPHSFTLLICQWEVPDSRPQIWNNQRRTERSSAGQKSYDHSGQDGPSFRRNASLAFWKIRRLDEQHGTITE